ncbi:MAG: polysaccharide deacetylase family protein [Actinomycetia bacterium]|nr:polysaccharide deacetylase family protein [Actinomycetes bacterium]
MDTTQPLPLRKRAHKRRRRRKHHLGPLIILFFVPIVLVSAVVIAALVLWSTTPVTSHPILPGSSEPQIHNALALLTDPNVAEDSNAVRIYLTFDDGPSATSTLAILDILAQYRVPATFFVVGYLAEQLPDIVQLTDQSGHVIANHSYSHDYEAVYASAEAFMQDLEYNEQVLSGILGHTPPRILRFPAGSAASQLDNDPALREAIKAMLAQGGWRYFDWNASMGDSISGWEPQLNELGDALVASIDEQVASGVTDIVVLAHDTDAKPWTPLDLPGVIEHCRQRGYVFKPLTLTSPAIEYR